MAQQLDCDEKMIRRVRARYGFVGEKPEGTTYLTKLASTDWGHGQAELVKPSTREATELVVFLSDMHFPYQDDAVVESALKLIKDLQPHRVVLNGDIYDFFQLSRFNTGRDREDSLQDEIDQGIYFRTQVRKRAPNAVIDETEGNHDNRIISFVHKNAKSLHSLRALKPANLFGYNELGINWYPGCGYLLREHFIVKHGTKVSSVPGSTAKGELLLNMISGVSGHVHRAERADYHSYRELSWQVSGTMCRLDPDYIVGKPNWSQGILVGEFSTRTPSFLVTNVPMMDGKLRFGGKGF